MEELLVGHKSPNYDAGIIFAPYIMQTTTSIIDDNSKLLEKANKIVISTNRERQIDSIIGDEEFIPLTLEETDEYKEYQSKLYKPSKMVSSKYYTCSSNYSTISIKNGLIA